MTAHRSAGAQIELESVPCIGCGGGAARELFVGRDYRFGRPDPYTMVECQRCGLVYLNPRPTAESVQALYAADYTPGQDQRVPAREDGPPRDTALRRFWHRLTGLYIDEVVTRAEGRVLDLGCGDGELLLRLRAQGLDAAGVESNPRYSPMHERRALSVFCGSLEDAAFPSSTFDTVILSQVVEHLPDPGRTLVEIRRILAPGGRVLIYCPNARGYLRRWFGKYWHGWHIPFHFYVFSADTIARLAAQAGFQVRRIDGVTPNDFFVASLKSLLYGRREGARAPDRGRFLDTKPFRLIVAPLFRVLDLLQRGREDCLKVELVR